MTLDEFVERAKLEVEAMANATRQHHTTTPAEFPLDRDEDDWWLELEAYLAVVELEGVLKPSPRQKGNRDGR